MNSVFRQGRDRPGPPPPFPPGPVQGRGNPGNPFPATPGATPPPGTAWVGGVLLALILGLPMPGGGQTAVVTGRVVDAETRAPLSGALVRVLPQGLEVLSDDQGRFRIEGVIPGLVAVQASFLGYAPARETDVMARTSRPTFVELALVPAPLEVEGLTVQADLFRPREDAPTSTQRLTEVEIRRTPGAIGDISRTLLSLPGVLSGVDNRNDLLVRGGGPSENAYYLDGIRIPQINHFATQGTAGGALALVNADFIQDVTFFTGGFPARFGDALSSVLLIETRPGNSDQTAGDLTLGASEAGLTLDGPLGRKGDWLFSLRRSYLQFLFQALNLPIRPDYWDAQLSANFEPTPGDRFTLTAIGAIDEFGIVPPDPEDDYAYREVFRSVLRNDQRAFTLGGSWRRLTGRGSVWRARLSYSRTDYRFRDDDENSGLELLRNRSVETDLRLEGEGEASVAPGSRLAAGFEMVRSGIEARVYQRALPGGALPRDIRYASEVAFWKPALWGQVLLHRGPVHATLGLRWEGVSILDEPWSLSPRLALRYSAGQGVDLTFAGGWFHQAPSRLALSVKEDGRRVNAALPQLRNRQVVAGADWRVNPGLRVRLEGFFKDYDRMPVLASDPRINLANLGDDYGFVGAEPLLPLGRGRAKGAELFAQQKLTSSLYFLGAYTLSWSEFSGADGVLRPSAWDRRHALDLTAGYRVGEAWEIGTKLRALSGVAVTPWDLEASARTYPLSGRGVKDWGRVGALRSPAYVRWDVRVERMWFFRRWNAVVYLDLQNVLNRPNVVGWRYTEDPAYPDRLRPIQSVAFLPTFGFSVEF